MKNEWLDRKVESNFELARMLCLKSPFVAEMFVQAMEYPSSELTKSMTPQQRSELWAACMTWDRISERYWVDG